MDKTGAEVIMLVLLPVLLLQLSPLVSAVNIFFFTTTTDQTACIGAGFTCTGIPANFCCIPNRNATSVGIFSATDTVYSHVSIGEAPCEPPLSATSTGAICYTGSHFSGALWFNSPGRRLLAGELGSTPCETQMKPNGIVYTENGLKGHWILTTSDADELHSQMLNLPDAEKVNWLISQGATYNEL